MQQIALRSRTSQGLSFRERVLALNIELHFLLRARLTERFDKVVHPDPATAVDVALTAVSAVMREYILLDDYRPPLEPLEDERLMNELTELFTN
ncbi:MAG: hypothetical protein ACI841_001087 [Planctomycetota bacterium]